MADSPQAAEIWKWFSKVYSVGKRLHETLLCRTFPPSNPFWDFAGVALRGRGQLFPCLIGMGEARLMP
jgi:hypothetical protein